MLIEWVVLEHLWWSSISLGSRLLLLLLLILLSPLLLLWLLPFIIVVVIVLWTQKLLVPHANPLPFEVGLKDIYELRSLGNRFSFLWRQQKQATFLDFWIFNALASSSFYLFSFFDKYILFLFLTFFFFFFLLLKCFIILLFYFYLFIFRLLQIMI